MLSSEQVADLQSRVAVGQPKTQIASDLGVSRQILCQYLRVFWLTLTLYFLDSYILLSV